MRPFILFVLSLTLTAAELPDPTKDLSGRALIANLATLRSEVAATPKDPAVWAAVTRTYAMLALHTDPDMWGAYGPWWDYAHRARATLDGLRAGEPTTLDAALPGLWVDLLDRDARRVITTLDRLAPSSTNAEAKALRAMALGNPAEAAGSGALLTFARCSAAMLAGQHLDHSSSDAKNQDRWSYNVLRLRLDNGFNREELLRSISGDTVWMLQSAELDDATARLYLDALTRAMNLTLPADATRQAMVTALQAGLRSADLKIIAKDLFIASWRACTGCMTAKTGWSGASPGGLVALGDVARWNRDRHYLWLMYLTLWNDTNRINREVTTPIGADLGVILPVARALLQSGNRSGIAEMTAALRTDLALPQAQRLPSALHRAALARLSERDAAAAGTLIDAIIAEGPMDPRAAVELATICQRTGRNDVAKALIADLAAKNPWNWSIAKTWASYDPLVPMLALPATGAVATWQDTQVDVTSPLTARDMQAENAAIRWTGTISLPTAGAWQLAVESDDGSQLVVGTARVDNGGNHAMERRGMVVNGPAKDLPLRVEFYNRGGGLGCRLWWKGPEDAEFVLVPATALRSGGQPGLHAELFNFASEGALDAALATPVANDFLQVAPWNAWAAEAVAERLRNTGQWAAAATAFAHAAELKEPDAPNGHFTAERIQCLLLQDPPAGATAAALIREPSGWWMGERSLDPLLHRVVEYPGLAQQMAPLLAGTTKARSDGRHLQADGELIHLQAAMTIGDLPQALLAAHAVAKYREGSSARCDWPKEAIILEVLLARLLEPDWRPSKPLAEQVKFCCDKPMFSALADWLSGDSEWTQVVEATPENMRTGDLPFLHALYLISTGAHPAAKAELQTCLQTMPTNNTYHHFAKAMLAWYDQQTPESLAAVTRAKPLRMGASVPTGAGAGAGGANDF